MTSLDEIIDRVTAESGADFSFVLTRLGRLVTKHAPDAMPDAGRAQLVALADELAAAGHLGVVHRSMPRNALVPYGGVGPIDVYLAARAEAIVCAVMANYAAQDRVVPALVAGLADLDELLAVESDKRARRRGRAGAPQPARPTRVPPAKGSERGSKAPPAKGSERGSKAPPARKSRPGKASIPPPPRLPGRSTIPFLEPMPPVLPTPPPAPPEISIGEALLGRGSLAAIEVDADGPEITISEVHIGRATMAEIELSALPTASGRTTAPELIRVSLATMPELDASGDVTERQTLPFVEPAADLMRAFEAKSKAAARAAGAAVVGLTKERVVVAGVSPPRRAREPAPPPPKQGPPKQAPVAEAPAEAAPRNPRDSGVDAWRNALEDLVDDEPPTLTRPARK